MKVFLILLMLLITNQILAENCQGKFVTKLENNKIETYCLFEKLKVSSSCYSKKENCALVKKVKASRDLISDALSHAETQNPGSWACKQLGFKVLMGKTKSGSDVCTCENELGESVICISLTY